MSSWIEVKAILSHAPLDWSIWDQIFEQHGVNGTVQTENPPALSGYVPPDSEPQLQALQAALHEAGAIEVTTIEVPEVDWSEAWKQFFVPRRVGQTFMVVPSWTEFQPQPDDLVITLDPGQAFGTGDHPTTRGCLELLEKETAQSKDVADIGCGSGILSVGAGLLGAKSLTLVDTESVCVRSSQENLIRNGVTGTVIQGAGFEPLPANQTFDLVLSNIISAALIGLAHEAARRVRPGGAWIVSGIIESNWPDVLDKATRCGFTLQDHQQELDWVAARFRRP
jgi:ribosomal protein L11 methyltransferase